MRTIGAALLLVGPLLAHGCAASGAARQGEERRSYRQAHRAYDGAPPVVPHAVGELGREDCLACHAEGMDLGEDGIAPRTPHPERIACQQCHVEQVAGKATGMGNVFQGLRYAERGTRAYPGAPPTMPHPRHGRESCLGCHGENGGSPIRTPHPDRVQCLQCHVEPVPAAGLYRENAFGDGR